MCSLGANHVFRCLRIVVISYGVLATPVPWQDDDEDRHAHDEHIDDCKCHIQRCDGRLIHCVRSIAMRRATRRAQIRCAFDTF